ncbi:MAG: hypothetical protein ACLFUQ_06395 [Candidatus Izemoplasmataceae bacterium]
MATLVVVNGFIMSLYFHDNEYEYGLFKHSYIEAILPDQPTVGTLRTGIVRIRKPEWNAFEAGDYVLSRDIDDELLGTGRDFPLVSRVFSKDETAETLRITYDNEVTITVSMDDVIGLYERDAGLVGTYYYSAMFMRGYSLLMLSHIILLAGYYFVFIYDNPDRFLPVKKPSAPSQDQ